MIVPTHFIHEEHLFADLKTKIEAVVDSQCRLPDVPFCADFTTYVFEEFDWAMSADFWPTLQMLAEHCDDQLLLVAVLEPEPIHYFKAEFGYYNWATLPISLSNDEYWGFLNSSPIESPADALLFSAETLIWTSPSRKWVIWGEREPELCILASKDAKGITGWKSLTWALDICAYDRDSVFCRKFMQNFD